MMRLLGVALIMWPFAGLFVMLWKEEGPRAAGYVMGMVLGLVLPILSGLVLIRASSHEMGVLEYLRWILP